MIKTASLLFLGTGGSMGVPVIGCSCEVCRSDSLYNNRLRPSALLRVDGKKFIFDTGPDFRQQALKYNINKIDGVIYTHAHNDHTAGIDELRVYYMLYRESVPCLMSKETYQDIRTRFGYMFEVQPFEHQLLPRLTIEVLPNDRGQTKFLGVPLQYLSYEQTGMKVTGYRFGKFAYVTDIKNYKNTIFEDLEGVEVMVLSALRFTPSHMHFTIDEAIEFTKKVGAKQTWLTHLAHELEYEKTNSYLPPNIRLAYDGLDLQFEI